MSDSQILFRSVELRPTPPAGRRLAHRLAALAAASLLSAACGPGEDPAIAQGRALYEVNCQVCHGERAVGDGPMAATLPVPPVSLIEHVGHHSSSEMYRLVTGGIPPAMPPHTLSEEQVALIIEYVWTLVPEDQVEALREMQRQVEEMGAPAAGMPGMQMDHSGMPGMQSDSAGGAAPDR